MGTFFTIVGKFVLFWVRLGAFIKGNGQDEQEIIDRVDDIMSSVFGLMK